MLTALLPALAVLLALTSALLSMCHVQETAACADDPAARPGSPAGPHLLPVVHVSCAGDSSVC